MRTRLRRDVSRFWKDVQRKRKGLKSELISDMVGGIVKIALLASVSSEG